MKKWFSFKGLRLSRKRTAWVLPAAALLILAVVFGVLPLVDALKKTEDEIVLKKRALVRYDEFLRNRKKTEDELAQTLRQHEALQQRLLSGETPQLGTANLQEIVKRLSEKNGIAIRSFRILEPKEINSFRKVSVQIDFNPVNSMLSLGNFIYDIEHHEKELMISEMDLLVFNIRMPNNIQGNMVISGLMRSPKIKEKGRKS